MGQWYKTNTESHLRPTQHVDVFCFCLVSLPLPVHLILFLFKIRESIHVKCVFFLFWCIPDHPSWSDSGKVCRHHQWQNLWSWAVLWTGRSDIGKRLRRTTTHEVRRFERRWSSPAASPRNWKRWVLWVLKDFSKVEASSSTSTAFKADQRQIKRTEQLLGTSTASEGHQRDIKGTEPLLKASKPIDLLRITP